jgi:hypothetical protein
VSVECFGLVRLSSQLRDRPQVVKGAGLAVLISDPLHDLEAPAVPALRLVEPPAQLRDYPQLAEGVGLAVLVADPLHDLEAPAVPALRLVEPPARLRDHPQMVESNRDVFFIASSLVVILESYIDILRCIEVPMIIGDARKMTLDRHPCIIPSREGFARRIGDLGGDLVDESIPFHPTSLGMVLFGKTYEQTAHVVPSLPSPRQAHGVQEVALLEAEEGHGEAGVRIEQIAQK